MVRDEMKNRISMVLKDPVLQQGFEIICKENEELKEKISVLLSCKNCPENKGGWICVTLEEKLTKAKEIIKKLYSHIFQGMGFMEINDYNVQKAEVEQFLKESE